VTSQPPRLQTWGPRADSGRPGLETFVFEATTACNHSCGHCYNIWKGSLGAKAPPNPLTTTETLDILGAFLDQSGAGLCTLSGGEPLLRPDLPEIVDFLHARGVAINLVTNGTLLDEGALDWLCRGDRVSIFELPLLGPERAIHDMMSGAAGAFDRVTGAIAELKLRGQTVIGVFVATRQNIDGFRETLELGLALGLDGMMLNRFNPGGAGREHLDFQVDPSALQQVLDLAERASEELEFPVSCSIAMPPCLIDTGRYRHLTFGFCAAGTERAYYTLDAGGDVRPCNHSPTVLGNIARGDRFEEMVRGPAMQAFLAARPAFCRGCRLELQCQGGCKAAAEACYGSASEMDPFLRTFAERARKLV